MYFYAVEEKDEKPKTTPIFFEVVEESIKREEEKPKEEEKIVKEETKPKPTPEPEPKPVIEKKPVIEEKPKVEQVVAEKPIVEEKKIVEKEAAPKLVKAPEEIKKPKPPKELEKAKELEPVVEKKIVPTEKPKPSVERAKVISTPSAKGRISPIYPRSARRKGHEGEVVIEIEVSESGDIIDSSVVSSSGHEELDKAALAAARKTRFNPAQEDGINVKGRLRLPISFKLK